MNFTNIWKLCNEGSYETIILKLSNYSNQIIKNNYDRLLWECCINDKLDLGKWFYNNFDKIKNKELQLDTLYNENIINSKNYQNINELFYICSMNNKLDVCKWLYNIKAFEININYEPYQIEEYGKYSEKLLTIASDYNYYEMTKWLISKGSIVNTVNIDALMYACKSGNLEIVKLLIEHGSEIKYYHNDINRYYLAFEHACIFYNLDIVKYLGNKEKPNRHELINTLQSLYRVYHWDNHPERWIEFRYVYSLIEPYKNPIFISLLEWQILYNQDFFHDILSNTNNLSIEFINIFILNNINFEQNWNIENIIFFNAKNNENISIDLILKYYNSEINYNFDWASISENINITPDCINNNLNLPWNWTFIAKNINIDYEFIRLHINKFNCTIEENFLLLSNLSYNENIFEEDITKLPEIYWIWSFIITKSNINSDFVIKIQEKYFSNILTYIQDNIENRSNLINNNLKNEILIEKNNKLICLKNPNLDLNYIKNNRYKKIKDFDSFELQCILNNKYISIKFIKDYENIFIKKNKQLNILENNYKNFFKWLNDKDIEYLDSINLIKWNTNKLGKKLTIEFIKKYKLKNWNWDYISCNIEIKGNYDLPFNFFFFIYK